MIVEIEETEELEILPPKFEIISIAIIQSDLVNTEFEAVLKIGNPNYFALDLSSLRYELYGDGTFWASGIENDVLHIPAQDSLETEFRFTMNFIDMSRKLLDDVIAMRQVRYRFSGNVEAVPDICGVSPFNIRFEQSGLSNVKRSTTRR